MISTPPPKMPRKPVVSVIMANYNGAAYLSDAIGSVLKQTLSDLELIVSDDASTDDSVRIVNEAMVADARIRLIRGEQNHGPGAARNKALAIAEGDWIAIMDSDDLIHPDRLMRLVKLAEADGADIVADDLLQFDSRFVAPPRTLLPKGWARAPFWIGRDEYVRVNHFYGAGPALGYLKPIFRSSFLTQYRLQYDETLAVAEDYSFMLKMLSLEKKLRVYPALLYFYRRHVASTSHRLSEGALLAVKNADLALLDKSGSTEAGYLAVMKARLDSIETAIHYERLLASIKDRQWRRALGISVGRPRSFFLLRLPIYLRLKKLLNRSAPPKRSDRLQVCVLSRQRVVGRTNGSSTYLLDLAQSIGRQDIDIHFLAPSPTTLGRWPYLRLSDDLSIFRSYRVRGAWRCGPYIIAHDVRRLLRGALAICDRTLMRSGVTRRLKLKADPYSIAESLSRRDQLFIARHAPTFGDFLVADYCFLTECFPFALRPDAETAVIMHDRFSSRAEQYAAFGSTDSVASLGEEEECRRLALADCIVAIQFEEGDWVRRRIPDREVIVAPMAGRPAISPQLGRDDVLLFVGSSAKSNVDGVNWFLETCWPLIRKQRPDAMFEVAGSVCGALGPAPVGVRLLGFVDDLAPVYRRAGVVISPLRVGSGLKIKLIEALSHGKAVVGTSKTRQGVEQLVSEGVMVAETAEAFAAAVLDLLGNRTKRLEMAGRALEEVGRNFSPQACYGELVGRVIRSTQNYSSLSDSRGIDIARNEALPTPTTPKLAVDLRHQIRTECN